MIPVAQTKKKTDEQTEKTRNYQERARFETDGTIRQQFVWVNICVCLDSISGRLQLREDSNGVFFLQVTATQSYGTLNTLKIYDAPIL